ncbi:MAG: amidophosphoribosyltransferase [Phycisphaerales bacterium]
MSDIHLDVLDRAPDRPREACGVFAIWAEEEPARSAYYGLFALQHRGQESAGIATTDRTEILRRTGMGLVSQVFTPEMLAELDAHAAEGRGGAIGHNRYSTTGESNANNAQPMQCLFADGPMAVGHNGNLINAHLIRQDLEAQGHIFRSTSDTEVVLQLIAATASTDVEDPMAAALASLQGAFSLVFLFADRVEVARDPWGWRPLVLGRTPAGGFVAASETVALDVLGAEFIREVESGEIVTLSDDGFSSRRFADPAPRRAHCVFEHVYFASPASRVFGRTVQTVRERLGQRLWEEAPVDADLVTPMPDSGRSAATGYARASGLPYCEAIIPNRYVGRTFIKPTDDERRTAVRLKLNIIEDMVRDRRIIIVDDSIVRGTTTRLKMDQLRAAGAKEIHLRITCPPIRQPCYFGVDFAEPSKLIAATHDVEEIRALLGVDSLHFLSLDGLLDISSSDENPASEFCTACYSGEYRLTVDPALRKGVFHAGGLSE